MAHFITISYGAISQGLVWSIMVLGIFLSFRVLEYADMTVDGSLTLGGAVCATMITNGVAPVLAMVAAICAGAMAGFITGTLHTRLKIPTLLSGILTQTALYSINLGIMQKATISLYRIDTLYTQVAGLLNIDKNLAQLLTALLVCIIIMLFIWWFLNTELGYMLRATGNNQRLVRALGVNSNTMIVMGLSMANAIVSLGGASVAMSQSFADIQMGIGSMVIGLAGIIIGEELFGTKSILSNLVSLVLGSIVYRFLIALVLEVNPNPNNTKLVTAILVAFALALPMIKNAMKNARGGKGAEGGNS